MPCQGNKAESDKAELPSPGPADIHTCAHSTHPYAHMHLSPHRHMHTYKGVCISFFLYSGCLPSSVHSSLLRVVIHAVATNGAGLQLCALEFLQMSRQPARGWTTSRSRENWGMLSYISTIPPSFLPPQLKCTGR